MRLIDTVKAAEIDASDPNLPDLRKQVASGALRGPALRNRILSVAARHRDLWVDQLLGMEPPPADTHELPRGGVPYWPCGVDEILAMVGNLTIRSSDEWVDVGSGLGRVAILVHLLCGIRTRGVEIQGHLVRRARARCRELALNDVSFQHADAATVELCGTIFFLYAPFNGAQLRSFLHNLENVAQRNTITVCTVGLELDLSWLRPRSLSHESLALYDSVIAHDHA